jgi:hypothetical protein
MDADPSKETAMELLEYGAIVSASALTGAAIFGGIAYLVLIFGPDLDASAFGF